jgi:hypothetical protein
MKSIFTLITIVFFIYSCDNSQTVEEMGVPTTQYQEIGDSLSTISLQILLMNVGREMKSGGPVQTIDFCNLNASKLIDSLSKEYDVIISRITSKARNESNTATNFELELLKTLESYNLMDTVITKENQTTYYKTIKLGMPTCLKCHGVPETDISKETLNAIQTRYPKDVATGYQLGDFRGAWKIQFKK